MKALDQSVALVLINDEGEVQVVGCLTDKVNPAIRQQLEGAAESVQDAADILANQTHRGTRPDDLGTTEWREITLQRSERRGVECVGLRIERHGDVGLGGRHLVDRHPVLFEHLECIGQKADLMPHPWTVHRHQCHALFDAHGFDLSEFGDRCRADACATHRWHLRREHVEWDVVLSNGQQASRMQHLGTGRRDLLRFVVGQFQKLPRGRRCARVGAEHAGHIGPDLELPSVEQRREISARSVGPTASEQHCIACRIAGNETLRDQQRTERPKSLLQRGIRPKVAGRRQVVCPLRCRLARLGTQPIPRIEPQGRQAMRLQIGLANCRREQFTHRHDSSA